VSIIRRFDDYVRRVRLLFFNGHENARPLIMMHLTARCSEMEIRGATNRGNYREDNGLAEGRVCAVGKINQAAGSLVEFRCDGSRVHDLWTPRHFRPKIHYILHLARRSDASESYEGSRVLPEACQA